jgi:hypothetical protein
MDLETMVATKANTKVMVNGNLYEIDGDCIIKGVSEEDAAKLLQNPNWKPRGEAKKTGKTDRAKAKGSVKLVDSEGKKVEGQKQTVEDPPIPEEGEEWADPSPDFSLEWLRACAEAYEVAYKGKDKKKLAEKIRAAMYED